MSKKGVLHVSIDSTGQIFCESLCDRRGIEFCETFSTSSSFFLLVFSCFSRARLPFDSWILTTYLTITCDKLSGSPNVCAIVTTYVMFALNLSSFLVECGLMKRLTVASFWKLISDFRISNSIIYKWQGDKSTYGDKLAMNFLAISVLTTRESIDNREHAQSYDKKKKHEAIHSNLYFSPYNFWVDYLYCSSIAILCSLTSVQHTRCIDYDAAS